MTRRLRWWMVLLVGNASVIGWCIGERRWVEAIAPVLVQIAGGWIFSGDVEDASECAAERDMALDFLEEILDEHGPMECDPACGCVACRARRWQSFLAVAGVWERSI